MAIKINEIILSGNLCRDPELREVGEHTVCNFDIANNGYKDEVMFIQVEAWNRTAELVNQFCKKGSGVIIEGTLKIDQWEDASGNKKSRPKIKARLVHFTDKRGEKSEEPYEPPKATPQPAASPDDGPLF